MHALPFLRALVWIVLFTFSLSSIPHLDHMLHLASHLLSSPAYAAEIVAPENGGVPVELSRTPGP